MNTIKKNLLTAIVAMSTLALNAQNAETDMLPATVYKGKIIGAKTLPMITITAKSNAAEKVYELPVVNITARRSRNNIFPAVKHQGAHIASVNLPQVDIIAKRKTVSIAALYKAFKFMSNKI
ncbi:MAG TPA: hypothetical protein PKN75_01760 [Bacteroidia bacterium]|nr:hypothetical protein [Bacteroidia bacterium]HNU32300.1 hypothetical protein [Bacteroidia bacterium]